MYKLFFAALVMVEELKHRLCTTAAVPIKIAHITAVDDDDDDDDDDEVADTCVKTSSASSNTLLSTTSSSSLLLDDPNNRSFATGQEENTEEIDEKVFPILAVNGDISLIGSFDEIDFSKSL